MDSETHFKVAPVNGGSRYIEIGLFILEILFSFTFFRANLLKRVRWRRCHPLVKRAE